MLEINKYKFKPYLNQATLHARIDEMAVHIAEKYRDENPVFLGILKGSFIFMADLIRACNIRSEVEFVQCATYHGFDRSDEIDITSFFDMNKLKGRHVIIAEDIVDSGQTVGALAKKLEHLGCASVYLVTLLYKPEAFGGSRNPDLIGFSIPNDFVIGYGLDYDGQARELRDIYVKSD